LEVGCGTGHFTRWLAERGLHVTGVDTSPAMLAEARRGGSPACVLGDALALPFATRAFDLTFLITTLEFVSDPLRALAEAARVARHGVVVGVLNRHSLLGLRRRASRDGVGQSARFFSPGELARLARQAGRGRVQTVLWRTTLWPLPGLGTLPLPWGGFIGLALHLKKDDQGV
jgi:SAM-dependent methyltransferase